MDNGGVRWIFEEEISELIQNYELKRIRRFEGNTSQRQEACSRAINQLNKPYSLLTNNCEHFANEVQYSNPSSKQVQTGAAVAVGIASFFLIAFGINIENEK